MVTDEFSGIQTRLKIDRDGKKEARSLSRITEDKRLSWSKGTWDAESSGQCASKEKNKLRGKSPLNSLPVPPPLLAKPIFVGLGETAKGLRPTFFPLLGDDEENDERARAGAQRVYYYFLSQVCFFFFIMWPLKEAWIFAAAASTAGSFKSMSISSSGGFDDCELTNEK